MLQRVLVEVVDGQVQLTTFDYETLVRVTLDDAEATTPGVMLVDHATLQKSLTAATKGVRKKTLDTLPVSLRVNGQGVPVVEVDGYGVPLDATHTPDEFPLPSGEQT